jgi:DNA-binding MarR family transcriptional regulator
MPDSFPGELDDVPNASPLPRELADHGGSLLGLESILYVYTSIAYMNGTVPEIPDLLCMCASFRRASRALTQLYDEALRPLGLRATQFTILQVLSRAGEVSQGELGQILAMDSTTLTRTLRIMGREGWIAERRGEDRRERLLRLAKGGRYQFNHALPSWEKAQGQLGRQLGDKRWHDLLKVTNEVTDLATKRGDLS